jgi:ABC-2 type transport system ATP-binding protein
MNRDIAIEVSELTKSYGEILAVDHINFNVRQGEIFGFLGPNGAGKTTTIRLLTGLSKPTAGSACILGFDLGSQIADAKKYIGVVPELSNLYDELSAIDNLVFMAQLYGVPRDLLKEKTEQLLKMFRLHERGNQPFNTLSRGMKRALTIAAALVHGPRLLFLDEPTVGLDVVAARSLRSLVSDLRQQGITVFLTTHYLEEAALLCDRIAILVKGKIVKVGSPEALKASLGESLPIEVSFTKPAQELVKEFSKRFPLFHTVAVNDKVRIHGGALDEVLEAVLQFTKDSGIEMNSVNTISPTLEDAFIKITGLTPTIMATEKGRGK